MKRTIRDKGARVRTGADDEGWFPTMTYAAKQAQQKAQQTGKAVYVTVSRKKSDKYTPRRRVL